MKHIEPKLYWVRDMVDESIIKLTYIRSLDQLADSFTKVCIGKESFLAHRAKYMVEWRRNDEALLFNTAINNRGFVSE